MRALVFALGICALLVGGVFASSCSVSHKSDNFTACDNSSDCPAGQRCGDNGLCEGGQGDDGGAGDGGRPDGAVCPSQCTSCRMDTKECKVDCAISPATCNSPIVCPPGFTCDIRCTTPNSCRNGIDCTMGDGCEIDCSGQSACRGVKCGPGPCATECTGLQACREIDCGDSCACDVNCNNEALCEQISCTSEVCTKQLQRGCTSLGPGCFTCTD
jgi:hypothetical protein